jgi:hypothetical protein
VIGTEEWFVKNDPHAAIKQRNEGMVWAVWGVILAVLVLGGIGVGKLFAAEVRVTGLTGLTGLTEARRE